MLKKFSLMLRLGLLLLVSAALLSGGCSTVKKWAGYGTDDEDEETVPPEAQQETVMIDGKPYVRSKNPYWLSQPNAPEYLYVEKGTEFVGAQQTLINSLVKAMGAQQAKAAGKTIPPDKLQEMVRTEVDRILREQGLGGFVSQGKGGASAVVGRAVAVIPDLDTPKSYDGLNRTLAMALGSAMGKTKDLKVSPPESVQEALRKAAVAGKLSLAPNIKALGDALGVQGIVLTGIMPPEGGTQGAMVLQVYDTFTGLQEDAIVAPAAAGGVKPETVTKFAQDNALRVAGDLIKIALVRAGGVCQGRQGLPEPGAELGPQGGRPPQGGGTGQRGGQPQDPLGPGLHRGCPPGRDQGDGTPGKQRRRGPAVERRPLQGQR